MRLGIGSHTYPWSVGVPGFPAPSRPLTAADLLARAVSLGVKVVQIGDNLPLGRLGRPERLELRRRADELGLTLEVGTAGVAPEQLGPYLEIAAELGSRVLRTLIDTPEAPRQPPEVVSLLRPQLAGFRAAGVTLAIENHDRFKAQTLRRILAELDHPNLGICLDTSNSLGCLEGTEEVVNALGPHTVNLHLKDVRAFRPPHHKGFIIEGRPAGSGQLDIPWILGRLRSFGADPSAIVELWPPPDPDPDRAASREEAWAAESVRHLRTLIPD